MKECIGLGLSKQSSLENICLKKNSLETLAMVFSLGKIFLDYFLMTSMNLPLSSDNPGHDLLSKYTQ